MGPGWLAGEWDPGRRLILPQPGGRLTRVQRCGVDGCPSDAHGASPLCARHRRQYATSPTDGLEEWLAGGQPAVLQRRRCVDLPCAVMVEQTGCPRPAQGRAGLCAAHDVAWAKGRAKDLSWESFMATAAPLSDLGACVAACCYLGVAHPHRGLCEIHLRLWREAGRPDGDAFNVWAAGVRQPVNSRALSLRGLPELVTLELELVKSSV